jgi:hypothetical protein
VAVIEEARVYDPANPRDRRSLLEDAVDAEYESAKLSARAKRAAAAGAAEGHPHGRVPYGFRRLYDAHKAGVDVLYFDWEMTDDDLWERSYNMGQRPDDLKGLHYFFRPMIPPLDTPAGAAAFLDVVDFYTRGPDVLVILDTFSRAVEGEENSNDTVRRFYSYVGVGLKDRRVTWVRLDHAGKDSTKGARGGSAKGDDVDVIWRLERTDAGCALHSTGPGAAARMSWVPARVAFTRTDDDVLAYAPAVSMWPAGTKDLAAELDRLGVPLDTGERRARQEYGVRGTGSVIRAALKWRRLEADRVDVADFLDVA